MARMKLDYFRSLSLAAMVSLSTMSARADEVDQITVLGHQLAIKDDPVGKALYVDGKNVMADFMIGIDGTPLIVEGQPVVLASDANGGNGCEVSPFYISFPPTGEPVVTPLLDTCVLPTVVNKGDHLELTQPPNPAAPGDKWTYAPSTGFVHVATITYQPDQAQGWKNVADHRLDSIYSVMANSEIAVQIDHLLGSEADDFRKYLTGPALKGEYHGNDFFGVGCQAHNCDSAQAIIYLDDGTQTPYVAWKDDNAKIAVRPPVKEWPKKARVQLKAWAQKYM